MEHRHYRSLLRIARRLSRRQDEAEDLLHASLLIALEAGRSTGSPETHRWLAGVLRRQAALAGRSAIRARRRESAWQGGQPRLVEAPEPASRGEAAVARLPPALRIVVLLALGDHTRGEIRHLLRLSDQALRQRLSAARRRLAQSGWRDDDRSGDRGASAFGTLAFGAIRSALLPLARRTNPHLASHDPDGHLFAIGAHKPTICGNKSAIQP